MCVMRSIDVFYGFVCHIVKNCGLCACVLWCNQLMFSMDLCARI
jgi:hypothetical protein